MAERRLDGMLLFAQESDYWLTGYDSFGFCFFQCLYVGADGRVALLTRSADLRQAQHTSNIADMRVWKDGEGADPTRDLRAMLADLGARGRLGVEFDSYGLTHFNGRRLQAALAGFAELVDASTLIPSLRVDQVGRGNRLRARGGAPLRPRRPRRDRGDRGRRRRGRNPRGDASAPSSPPAATIPATNSSSARAPTRCSAATRAGGAGCRPTTSSRSNSPASAATTTPRSCAPMSSAGRSRCTSPITPPRARRSRPARPSCAPAGPPATSSPRTRAFFDAHGLSRHRLNACGYSLGAKFTPSWMDPPMFYERNDFVIAPDRSISST